MATEKKLFGLLSAECYGVFFNKLEFTNVPCVKLAVSKILSLGIILGAAVVKVPQILKIVKAGSIEGLSASMFILETLCYTMTCAYNIANGYPFTTYGENALLMFQGWVIVYLLASYSGKLGALFFTAVAGYFCCCGVLFGGYLSLNTLALLQASTAPVGAFSRIPQIVTNFTTKSTGQLAMITLAMNFLGSVARVFTTLTEVNDFVILCTICLSTLLNGILFLQVVLYWKSKSPASKDKKTK